MRGLLIVNPHATATTARTRDVLARALASDLKLDVAETFARGHAIELARDAAADGVEVIVALGGDGTVNEVVNGIAGTPTLFAVVPGGSTNVFARALGLSNSPVEATSEILDALRAGRTREISLGRANDRWFTFCAGLGIDAEVVKLVESHRKEGKPATPGLYVRQAVQHFFTACDRRVPSLTLTVDGGEPVPDIFNIVVANGSPWTYFGGRPLNPTPQADFDKGLDFLALRRLSTTTTLRVVKQMFGSSGRIRGRQVLQAHDVTDIHVVAGRPIAAQVDGDYLGEQSEVVYRCVPKALRVIV